MSCEAVALNLADAQPVTLDLDDCECVTLAFTESTITLDVTGIVGPRGQKGDQGDQGDAATIAVGDVDTGLPGSAASVVNSGTTGDAILDFVIPQGPVGPRGPAGLDTGFYRHDQAAPAAMWTITHSLGFYPSVSVQDSAGSVVYGDVYYLDANSLTITFQSAFGGHANLS